MKITIYELLGLSRNSENEIYVRYYNRLTQNNDVMWACKENIIYKLNQNIVYLDDEIEILDEPKEDKIEKLNLKVDTWCNPSQCDLELGKKIDEIIDKINKE